MKVPTPIQNLYADLRDRRMLSIAIVLVAAIIAVPFLLGGSGEDEVPPPPSVTAGAPFEGDEQLSPVVLADAPGLRDFHQRLASYESNNPFKPKVKVQASEDAEAEGTDVGTGPGAGADTGGSTDTGDDPVEIEIPGADSGSTTPVPGTDDGVDTGDGSSGDDGSSAGPQLISYRVDVRVGPLGDSKVVHDAETLDFLPDRRHPLVQYIDANTNGTRVAFIVNPTAAAVKGNAECVRSRKDCQYLVMKLGQEMLFIFEDRQYRIELRDIVEHREPYEPEGTSDDGGDSAQRELIEALGG